MNHAIVDVPGTDPGGTGYAYSKRAIAAFIHELAINLSPRKIRANAVHPTNVNTPMLMSEPMYKSFRRDLEHPTREDAERAFPAMQAFPIPFVEPVDISNAVVFLASDEARYITGMQLRIDAGGYLKWHGYHV
jgi:NAD(P)-dependent dehydrogenase (short-subunit alcohol dehydrogenase family)